MANTLGGETLKVAHKEESWSLNNRYTCKKACKLGTIVKLDVNTGEVEPVTAVGDTPFGVVTKGCTKDMEDVVIQTQYNGIYRAVASGAVALGDTLQGSKIDATSSLMAYKKATSGIIAAHALEDGADGDKIWVGVLRVFVTI